MEEKLDNVLNLYKRKSETPLQTIERYVKKHSEYKKVKMTYAGRLDPMAEGLLVVLTGEKNKEREAYTGLDKDYEFEFMLGVETDTFDILGKITSVSDVEVKQNEVSKAIMKYSGTFSQKYPPYSSKVLDGVPLFELARTGKLNHEKLPVHDVVVSKIEIIESKIVGKEELEKHVLDSIKKVSGDFRQTEILEMWDGYFGSKAPEKVTLFKAKVSCGSGFYVRQLVSDLGKDLRTGAVTISILRTRVGEFSLADSQR